MQAGETFCRPEKLVADRRGFVADPRNLVADRKDFVEDRKTIAEKYLKKNSKPREKKSYTTI